MNILVLSNSALKENQGSGYVILNTARCLGDLGNKVTVVPPEEFSFLKKLGSRGNNYRMAIGMAKWAVKNKNKIFNSDLIIAYGAEVSLALFVVKKILRYKMPFVLHSNGIELHVEYRLNYFKNVLNYHKKWYNVDQKILFDYCYRNADAIITVSKYDHDFAVNNLRINPNKVFYNEPALPNVFFDYPISPLPNKKPIITFCGSWIERKGIFSIVEAVPKILRQHSDYILRLIGVGEGFLVRDYFPKDILGRIEVISYVEKKEDLIKLYLETKIFLFPSFCESFGLVVAEAMFCNCAVITGPTGIASDLKNEVDAIVLKVPDGPNVYDALERIINDEGLLKKIANNAKERVQELRWRNYTYNISQIIDKVRF